MPQAPTPEQACYPRDPKGVLTCDICGELVPPNQNGLISWDIDEAGNVSSFRLTHKGKCDKHHQQPCSSMLDYVSEMGWGYVADTVAQRKWQGDALTRLVLIVWALLALKNPDWKPEY